MYEYKVKEIAKVVDGDTVDVIIDLGFGLSKKERCRIAGIDTPEKRTRDLKEKKYGIEATEFMTELLDKAENLIVRTEKDGKYGRMLGWFYCDNIDGSLNNLMIEAGYAWSYDGGTKDGSTDRFQVLEDKRAAYAALIAESAE
jgi:endonuclease YncB( thermonuclease family)